MGHAANRRKNVPGRGGGKHKGPGVGVSSPANRVSSVKGGGAEEDTRGPFGTAL